MLGHEPRKTEEEEKEPARKKLLDILQQKYGFTEEDLITAELEAVPAGPARFVGLDESMIGGYGQDDRICLYCALMALLAVEKPRQTIAVMFWDKEEIGSEGASGASSRFLQYCIVPRLVPAGLAFPCFFAHPGHFRGCYGRAGPGLPGCA